MEEIILAILADHRACAKYRSMLSSAVTKRQAVDIALSAQGIEYLACAIARGVVSADQIHREFSRFADGSYVRDADGYTSALFVRQPLAVVPTAAALVVECREIEVATPVCEIHAVDCPRLRISGRSAVRLFLYGSSSVGAQDPETSIISPQS